MIGLLSLTALHAEFQPWTQKLLHLAYKMDENNMTQARIQEVAAEEKAFYDGILNDILLNKNEFLSNPKKYDTETFGLERMIRINKRMHNEYAVIRDQVLVKSYKLIQIQNRMVREIIQALDYYDIDDFEKKMSDLFAQSQIEIHALEDVDYKQYLKKKENNKILKAAQKNIRDYYALFEINSDILKYLSLSDKKMYRLNKYAQYGLLSSMNYINHNPVVKRIDEWLEVVGLDMVKIVLILLVSFIIYFIRRVLYGVIEKVLLKTTYLKRYTEEILSDIRFPITSLLLIINLELALYIYYDFSTFTLMSQIFNIIYGLFSTLIFYQVINSIARVKLESIDHADKKIKDEMINVTLKIINFLIIIFGLLLVLYLAGVNLTAVLSGLGIGGFAVALAARESLANFFGTVSILMSDMFSQGDWIVVDGKEGTVVEIGLRVTTLRTFDNAMISIPNGVLANGDVKNWSRRVIGRRIKMKLAVKYDSKASDLSTAIEAIREMLKEHKGIATENTSYSARLNKSAKLVSREDSLGVKRTLLVYLDEFSESSINILVYCFSKTTDWNEWLKVKEDVMYKIMDILEENHLEFAFPSLSIYQEDEEKA
ncbi:MAG: mechanosensitive ion channel family protein [Epsilonproteobacteria bacterium]|nr:mechanosensitive ion channel family protein [Campylobacterota bacterium]